MNDDLCLCGHPKGWHLSFVNLSTHTFHICGGMTCDCHCFRPMKEYFEYLRSEILAERISWQEVAELQSLKEFIPSDDVLLREWAGIPEGE